MRYAQLTEDVATDIAVFYGGRFQPMHKGHHKVYMGLVEQFGSSNVFIATTVSKTATPERDPFSFEEKKKIMNQMFNIPTSNVIQTQPYRPDVSLTGVTTEICNDGVAEAEFTVALSAGEVGTGWEFDYKIDNGTATTVNATFSPFSLTSKSEGVFTLSSVNHVNLP